MEQNSYKQKLLLNLKLRRQQLQLTRFNYMYMQAADILWHIIKLSILFLQAYQH